MFLRMENELTKIKQLFNSPDITNHKLAYTLAKNILGMADKEICYLVLNDGGGWNNIVYDSFVLRKQLFNGSVIIRIGNSSPIDIKQLYLSLSINNSSAHFCISKNKQSKRFKIVNNWFAKLDKE